VCHSPLNSKSAADDGPEAVGAAGPLRPAVPLSPWPSSESLDDCYRALDKSVSQRDPNDVVQLVAVRPRNKPDTFGADRVIARGESRQK
jgi:hypothetical protein